MKPGITLIDGEERHRRSPATFQIPTDLMKNSIQPGDLIKIVVEDEADRAGKSYLTPERFWVRTTQVSAEGLEGVITDYLPSADYYGMYCGDSISIERRHVLDIKTIEEQATAKLLDEEFVTISAEALENTLPGEPRLRCELDNQTHVVIGRKPDAVYVDVLLRRFALEASEPMDGSSYAKAYQAVASRLGWVPLDFEKNGSTEFCRFVIHLPVDVTGHELIRQVRESEASLHIETKKHLASGSHVAPAPDKDLRPELPRSLTTMPSSKPKITLIAKRPDLPVDTLPFKMVVGYEPAAGQTLTLKVEQFHRIDTATLPAGVHVTILDGAWQPITLKREESLLSVQVDRDISQYRAGRRRKRFVQALADAADSLAYADTIMEATVVPAKNGRHVVLSWKEPFDLQTTSKTTIDRVRFHWDVLLNRAEKMLGR